MLSSCPEIKKKLDFPFATTIFISQVLKYVTVLEMDPRGPKNCRSKILPFLYSFGHTEAKKIPENFFHWYHFLCYKKTCLNFSKFFSGHFEKKIFLAVTNFWTFLMSFSQKNFFANFHLKKSC